MSDAGAERQVEDYEWRPTFLPGAKLRPISKEIFESDNRKAAAMSYVTSISELDQVHCVLVENNQIACRSLYRLV